MQERAEWINSIIHQLWQNVGHYTRKIINDTVEPEVKKALNGYGLTGFKFEKVVLGKKKNLKFKNFKISFNYRNVFIPYNFLTFFSGRIPPRVTGIKVYDKNVARDEIIMDLDLVFASDCDIKFSLKKISAKIGDFSLRGLLRVVFKPLITDVPLIGGVQVYFLTPPEIDFDLGGVANALDAPGTQIKSSQFLKIMHKCGSVRCHLGCRVFF